MKGSLIEMYKDQQKMIDIYESDLEDYFKYLLQRVNKFLNSKPEYTDKKIIQSKRTPSAKKLQG